MLQMHSCRADVRFRPAARHVCSISGCLSDMRRRIRMARADTSLQAKGPQMGMEHDACALICPWLIEAVLVYGQMHACLEKTPARDMLMCMALLGQEGGARSHAILLESIKEASRGRLCSRAHPLGSVVSASRWGTAVQGATRPFLSTASITATACRLMAAF